MNLHARWTTRKHGRLVLTGGLAFLASTAALQAVQITTAIVASGLNRPVCCVAPPGDTERLFVVEKRGVIRIIQLNRDNPTQSTLLATPFLNISQGATVAADRLVVSINDFTGDRDERGLLGMAFHPDFAQNGFFYLNYINVSSDTVVRRFSVSAGDPNVATTAGSLILMTIDQPQNNHNGGCMHFGDDGMLYIATGDGGGAGDVHGTFGNAQNLTNLLGKILRIDVNSDGFPADAARNYAIPADNPFVGPIGDPTNAIADELWNFGLRNPWRFSFDRRTQDLYIADVGQDEWEEVNFAPAASAGGENYGWRCMEGNHSFTSPSGPNCTAFGANLTDPVLEYAHSVTGTDNESVTGGYVYRGIRIPGENGNYFYGDFFSGRIWSFRIISGSAIGNVLRLTFGDLTSFGEDGEGELYLVNGISGTTSGVIRKLVAVCNDPADINADCAANGVDADVLAAVLVGIDPLDPALIFRCDVNRDGRRDGQDINAWLDALLN